MAQQQQAESKKGFLQNDRKLVCSMLIVYGFCILVLIAVTFLGLDRRAKSISANATSTAFALATQQANSTATAVAHRKELDEYEFIDRFDSNANDWLVGNQNNDYWIGRATIKDGVYVWDVEKIKKLFIYWTTYDKTKKVKDFDIYVDSKILEGKPNQVCTGLIFRRSTAGWDHGGYAFFICNSAFFNVSYHEGDDWQEISDWQHSSLIRPADWNRIEVHARGDRFTFAINNVVVYEMTDKRQKDGEIALFVELNDQNPAKISFDNFGYQPR